METTSNAIGVVARDVGTGLRNYRNNCFFNATLQSLFHIPSVISCMLDNERRHEDCVTCTLRDTFMQTRQWSRPIFPSNLYSLLKKVHGNLLNGEFQDAHNFLLSLLDSANSLQHNDSSISSKFLSSIKSTTICEECGNKCTQSAGYFSIPIDIIETAHIDHALRTFFEKERVNKFCEKCKRNVTAVKQFKLTRAPIVLCLQIKRFSIGSKIEDCVEIGHDLTVSKKMQHKGCSDIEYKLKAIICHTGSLNTGHYKTIVCENEKLYEFNDALVKQIPEMKIIKSKEAYVLFYELHNQKEILPQSEDTSNAECNNHMANEAVLTDPGSDHQRANCDKDTSNAECNIHMANNLSITDESILVEPIDVDDNESETMTDTSNAKRSQHMANDCTPTDGWKQVEITDIDGGDNVLDWLNGLTTDDGSDNLHENENQLSGRRIIDMEYFFDQLERCTNIICKSCRTGAMHFIKESRMGLASSFILACTDCGKTKRLLSDQKNKKNESKPNEAAALGIVSIGLGFNHLEELCTILKIPCMSYKTYHRMDKKLQNDWWTLAKKSQEDSLNEEIRLAKELKQVDSAGNALIPVKADGSWHTRSYGSNFTSLAGCAAIIGVRTNKIIYMDIKSKYCHVCKIAEANCTPPNIHECNANYDGPSSGMETAIIVEGFKYCETKGARFNKFIGDGDSNTYKTLRDLRLYKNPFVYIEKFDCLNHLHKNFAKKYIVLCKSKKTNPAARNLLTRKIGENISKGVRMAAKHWKKTNLSEEEKCNNIQKDCMNAPLHCFGVHDNCAEYYCTKSTTPQAREFVIALKNHRLYLPVLNLCQHYFANNAKSLLAGYDSNAAEGYNGLIAKYTGGKRVFNALARSYKGRTAQAAVQYNSEGHSISSFQKYKYDNPQRACLKLEASRKRKVIGNAVRDQLKPKKRKNDKSRGNSNKKRRPYGEGHEDLDFTPSEMETAKNNFLQQLDEDRQNRDSIQIQTKGQRFNTRWSEIRQNLLTSSYFGRILNVINRKSYSNIVDDILYHNNQYSHAAEFVHQHLHEEDALKIFCDGYKNEIIDTCGIFIDADHSFLGASPFRLCGEEGLLMVKCPHKLYKKSIVDSIKEKSIPFWKFVDGEIRVNTKSLWYIEIQGQLHISNKKYGYLVVYLDETEYKIEKVTRDDNFWKNQMKDELIFFFNEAMVKELVNPRDERCMELRKYDESSKTFI